VGPTAGLDRRENSGPTGIRFPDRPARSQSIYRLRYPPTLFQEYCVIFLLSYSGRDCKITRFPSYATSRILGIIYLQFSV
jgi:hypothetical protein